MLRLLGVVGRVVSTASTCGGSVIVDAVGSGAAADDLPQKTCNAFCGNPVCASVHQPPDPGTCEEECLYSLVLVTATCESLQAAFLACAMGAPMCSFEACTPEGDAVTQCCVAAGNAECNGGGGGAGGA